MKVLRLFTFVSTLTETQWRVRFQNFMTLLCLVFFSVGSQRSENVRFLLKIVEKLPNFIQNLLLLKKALVGPT